MLLVTGVFEPSYKLGAMAHDLGALATVQPHDQLKLTFQQNEIKSYFTIQYQNEIKTSKFNIYTIQKYVNYVLSEWKESTLSDQSSIKKLPS